MIGKVLLGLVLIIGASTIPDSFSSLKAESSIAPEFTFDFPKTVNIDQTFTIHYTYTWKDTDRYFGSSIPSDMERYDNYFANNDYLLRFYLPDEFSMLSSNFTTYNYLADLYEDHVLKKHFMFIPYEFTKDHQGSIQFRLDKEMTHDVDYMQIRTDPHSDISYFIIKQDNGIKFVSEDEMGQNVMIGAWVQDAIADYPERYQHFFITETNEYTPSIRTEKPPANVVIGPQYLDDAGWQGFAKFLRTVQINPNPSNMTQWLLDNNLSQEFIDDFFAEYPEFAGVETFSPFPQVQTPINEILCSKNKILMQSISGNPYCVSSETAEKLEKRGFSIVINQNSNDKIIEQLVSQKNNTLITPQVNSIYVESVNDTKQTLILNPDVATMNKLIPQDITFDYTFKVPINEPDDFVQELMIFADDAPANPSDTKNSSTKWNTKRGYIQLYPDPTNDYQLKYTFLGTGRIHPSQAEQFTNNLLSHLGIILDGTEQYRESGPPAISSFTHGFAQQKDDHTIGTNQIVTAFDAGQTFLYIGNWNDNLDELNLYDAKQAQQNGIDYLLEFEEITGPNCNVGFKGMLDTQSFGLDILNGRPVYVGYAGTCTVPVSDGHYFEYFVYVDALTGKALFAKTGVMF